MKKLEKRMYAVCMMLLLGALLYYSYQYTRLEINQVHLDVGPMAVPQIDREWEVAAPVSSLLTSWDGYNTIVYQDPPLPAHKEKQGQLVYYDRAAQKLYSGSLCSGTLHEMYRLEDGWSLQDYDLTTASKVLVAVGKILHGPKGVTHWVKGLLIDARQATPEVRPVFEQKGDWAENQWYEFKALQFSPDGTYILHQYYGYETERVTVYDANTLQPIPITIAPQDDRDFGFTYVGWIGSTMLLTALEESFYLYQYDLTRNQYDYGSYYDFLPVNIFPHQGKFYAFGRSMGGRETYHLTRVPYLTNDSSFTALGEKGQQLRSKLTPTSAKTAEVPKGQQVITVSNVHELIDAIGSHRTIRLRPGIYNLSSIQSENNQHITLDDDDGVMIHNVENLSLQAAAPLWAELVVDSSFVNVLNLQDCKQVQLQGLLIGHHPQSADCQGAVLDLAHCTQMQIRDCIFFTSGMYGLKLTQVEQLAVEHALITDSTLAAAEVIESKQVTFRDVHFIENGGGLAVKYSSHVSFHQCEIAKNQCDHLLEIVESERVLLRESQITGNQGGYLLDKKANVQLQNCRIEGNAFTIPYTEPVAQQGGVG